MISGADFGSAANACGDGLLKFSRTGKLDPSVSKPGMEGLFRDAWQELKRDGPDRVMMLKIDKLPDCTADRNLVS